MKSGISSPGHLESKTDQSASIMRMSTLCGYLSKDIIAHKVTLMDSEEYQIGVTGTARKGPSAKNFLFA